LFEKYIFYPAQMWRHKNHKNLVRAIAHLHEKGLVVNAIFCGARKEGFQEILEEIQSNGLTNQVRHLDYVDESILVELYRRAVALVMPTYFGPTNIPPLEAFELGCPVAISNAYAMPEQVGEAALLFDPSSVEEIASAIERLWTDEALRLDLIEKGRRRAREWNQAAFTDRFYRIVDLVLRETQPDNMAM